MAKEPIVNVLIPYGFGLNCENETYHAFKCDFVGAKPELVHLTDLYNGKVKVKDFDIIAWIGGFHGGDDPNGAAIKWAYDAKSTILDDLLEFADDNDKAMIGICNGFQFLSRTGLVPGYDRNQSISVSYNDCGRFRDDWVEMKVDPESPCIWTKCLDTIASPIRHGEGKVVADREVMDAMLSDHLIPVRYSIWKTGELADKTFPHNPNGSEYDAAGVCDLSGRLFGLMPHPEAYLHVTNHPNFSEYAYKMRKEGKKIENRAGFGLKILKNGVDYVRSRK